MQRTRKLLRALRGDRSGISSVEYALLLAFIAGGIIVAADALSQAVEDQMNTTKGCISGSIVPAEC